MRGICETMFGQRRRKCPPGEKVLWLWIALSVAITLSIALAAPPNNDDALTYHMSRVAHWWVNHTVAFYPTNIQRQLCLSPFAEYVILQFYVLSGGSDRMASLVQWFSFGGCAIAMSLIARRLGADRFTQCVVAFVVLTTPLSILQATSTHNDLTCAFLAAMAIYFLYCDRTVLTGICLGLAMLVKLNAAFAVAPFLLLIFFRESFHRRGILRSAGRLAAIGGIALALNTPQWLRNIHTFDNPFSSEAHFKRVAPETHAFGPFVTNVLRDLTVELATPFPRINQIEEDAVREICKVLRLDPDDPRNTGYAVPEQPYRFTVTDPGLSEDYAGNLLETCLLIAATIFLLASRRLRRSQFAMFTGFVWAGYLLVALLLSWQPAVTRYLEPFIVLSSLPIAFFLSEIRSRSRFISWAIIAILAVVSLNPLRHNPDRRLVTFRPPRSVFTTPREEQYPCITSILSALSFFPQSSSLGRSSDWASSAATSSGGPSRRPSSRATSKTSSATTTWLRSPARVSNFILALSGFLGLVAIILSTRNLPSQQNAFNSGVDAIALLCELSIQVNLALFIFNLLPIPPLDGSRLVRNFLPYKALEAYDRIGMFSYILMIVIGGTVVGFLLGPAILLISPLLDHIQGS